MIQYSKNTPKLEIKDTNKYGKGIFALENIKKGQIIYILQGKKIDIMDLVNEINSDRESIDDPFQIGRRTYIDLDEISRTFNHSCNPTAGIRKNSEMFALRNIKKGEEITYDYSLTVAPTEWKMNCECGSENCRKILSDILSVPKDRINYYSKLGALQNYMKLLLKDVKKGKYKMPKYELIAQKKVKMTSKN